MAPWWLLGVGTTWYILVMLVLAILVCRGKTALGPLSLSEESGIVPIDVVKVSDLPAASRGGIPLPPGLSFLLPEEQADAVSSPDKSGEESADIAVPAAPCLCRAEENCGECEGEEIETESCSTQSKLGISSDGHWVRSQLPSQDPELKASLDQRGDVSRVPLTPTPGLSTSHRDPRAELGSSALPPVED